MNNAICGHNSSQIYNYNTPLSYPDMHLLADDPVDRVVAAEWVEVGVERSWGRNSKEEITRKGNTVGEKMITRRMRRLDSRAKL